MSLFVIVQVIKQRERVLLFPFSKKKEMTKLKQGLILACAIQALAAPC